MFGGFNLRARMSGATAAVVLAALCIQVASAPPVLAAQGDISTVAGNGTAGYTGDGGPARSATLTTPTQAIEDAAGNIYVADMGNHVVRKVGTSGNISTFAGNGTDGYSGDGGPATSAQLDHPFGLALDSAGNLYIADQGANNRIRKVDASGNISTFAGNGSGSTSGDGGPAINAGFNPQFMVITASGFFFTDFNNSNVRKIDSSGNISTFASGIPNAEGLGADPAGNLYVTAFGSNQVDKVDTTGTVTTIAGTGSADYGGDGGPATAATFWGPADVKWGNGSLYISDSNNNAIRKIDRNGIVTTVVGGNGPGLSGDGGPARLAKLSDPVGLGLAPNGDLLVGDLNNNALRRVQQVAPPDLLALNASAPSGVRFGRQLTYQLSVVDPGSVGDASQVSLTDTLPTGVSAPSATTSQGSCSVSSPTVSCSLGTIAAGAAATVTITVTAPAVLGQLTDTASVSAQQADPFTPDNSTTVLTLVSTGQGFISTIAGNGTAGYSGDGGPASAALFNNPTAVRADAAGNLYVSDQSNNVVRKIDTFGNVSTIAGNGTAGFGGDGGPATAAQLNQPTFLALDGHGDVFIADSGNSRVREVDPSGYIRTVAGNGLGFDTGESVPAVQSGLGSIGGLAVDATGTLYIGDDYFDRVRKVDPFGIITRLTGTGGQRTRGDGGPAFLAAIGPPDGMSVDGNNNLYIATGFPTDNIRKIDLTTGIITTVAGAVDPDGTGLGGPSGDGGPATVARFSRPFDVTVDPAGDLFIADIAGFFGANNDAIRMVDTHGIVSTIAGTVASGYSGDGGPATGALLNSPESALPLPNSAVVIADSGNNALRFIQGAPDLLSLAQQSPLQVGAGASFAYQLQVRNDASVGDAGAVVVSDQLPAGATYTGATPSQGSCAASGTTITCQLGPLAGGTVATVAINVTAPGTSATLTANASVSAQQSDPFAADNAASSTTYVSAADLVTLQIASPNPGADVGAALTYTTTITNRGPTPATSVVLSDPLPAGMKIVSASAGQGTCTSGAGTVTCPLGTLGVGSTTTVTVVTKPSKAGLATNTATVSGDQVDPFPGNNVSTTLVTVSGAGCGQTIKQSVTLTKDIGPCAGDGLIIGADKITVNLGGHRVFGLGNGTGFSKADNLVGIYLPARTGVKITGGTVSSFDTGIFVNSGVSNTITKMTVSDNIGLDSTVGPFPNLGDGILIEDSSLNKVVSNTVAHNGTYDGVGIFGLDTNSNLVQGNTIKNTVTDIGGADGEGVIVNSFLAVFNNRRGESISHNNVLNNVITGNAASGISNNSNDNALIAGNTVTGNGLLAFPNNGIGDQVGGHANPFSQEAISGNTISGNGGDGIQVLRPTSGDTITGNTVSSNNALNAGFWNLEDTNGNCTTNMWSNNTVTNGPVSPACLTGGPSVGGQAPAAAQAAAGASGPAASAQGAVPGAGVEPYPQAHRNLPPPASGR